MDLLKAHLQTTTYTINEAYQRLSVLRQLLENIFFTQDDSRGVTVDRYQQELSQLPEADQHALSSLSPDFLHDLNTENIHNVMAEVRQWLQDRPAMTLYVPVVFEAEQIKTIGTWCRAEILPELFLELIVEPSVIGGCAFIHDSNYHDLSLRARLQASPDTIPKVVKSYESA